MVRTVRSSKPRTPLAYPSKMDEAARLQFEQDNIRQCVDFARDQLGLRVT
jgi:hypothetical protein